MLPDLERILIGLGRLRTGTETRAESVHEDSAPAFDTELIRRWVWTSTVPSFRPGSVQQPAQCSIRQYFRLEPFAGLA